MDSVLREYIVNSKADGAELINKLKRAGCKTEAVLSNALPFAAIPNTYYYYIWSDGTVTGQDTKSEMTELFADTFQSITI